MEPFFGKVLTADAQKLTERSFGVKRVYDEEREVRLAEGA